MECDEVRQLIEELKSGLAAVLPHHPNVVLAYLYGSAAEGRATPLSDVDIALVTREPPPYPQLKLELRVENELIDHTGIHNVEVRIINGAPLSIRGQVACRGVLLYSADEGLRVEFETRTRDEYFDYQPIARQLREAFFADVRERGLHGKRREDSEPHR